MPKGIFKKCSMRILALKVNGNPIIYTFISLISFITYKVSRRSKAIMLTFLFLMTGIGLFIVSAVGDTPAADGTYQFVFSKPGREDPVSLTNIQLIAVENIRKENEVVYAASVSNDYIKVKILPRNVINKSGFTLAERNIYKSNMTEQELATMRYVQLP
jgi:hypothetical protein